MTRLDIYLNERPIQSIDLQAGSAEFTIARTNTEPLNLEIRGFDGTLLVARYRHTIA
jgi:hypothetical protein